MLYFIIYMLIAALCFSGCYIGMRYIYKERRSWYDDGDMVLISTVLSVPWALTIWFVIPYLIVNIRNIQRKSQ